MFGELAKGFKDELLNIRNDTTINDIIRNLNEGWIDVFQHKDLFPGLFLPNYLAIFNISWEIAEKIQIWYTVIPADLRPQILEDDDVIIDGSFLQDYKDYGHNFSDSE